ncbi:MAG TPA: sugar ABC transporter ATP-binding protein [Anaerolineaceae bacterium]
MSEEAPVLTLEHVSKSFSGVTVLKDIHLDFYPGEVHCLVGENGAGKSTLIKIISGAYQPDHGTITYRGQAIRNISPYWARFNGINTIYQEIDLVPSLSAAENISLGYEPATRAGNIDWLAVRRKAAQILADMGAELDINTPVANLTVAYQEMVAIARALSLNSRVLILDEPTAVFTSTEIDLLFGIIRKLKAQGIAIIYISHHLDEIFQIGDRVTVLRDGNLIRTGRIHEFDKQSLVRAMVGRDIDLSRRDAGVKMGEEVLRVEGLSRGSSVCSASFCLHRGEIVGVAGLVGAGRTELARLITGADRPTGGKITLRGKAVRFRSPLQALHQGVGMLPESRKEEGLVLSRSMLENISYGMIEKWSRLEIVPWKRIRGQGMELIETLDIRPRNPNLPSESMSGGNQQKVVLAKLLAAQCEVLILDEPTRGVDIGARMEIYRLMQEIKQSGKAILMISSDLPEILTQTDRILVMACGRIAGELASIDATEEKVLSIALQVQPEDEYERIH